ncbi:MAG: alpha/beta hydrolase [Elusimicrobia bacterium]|nr:alpha/beta hydrolase [Elusimicrobiota bacterium]
MRPHSASQVFRYKGVKMVGVLNWLESSKNQKLPAVLFLHGFPGAEKNTDIQRELLKHGIASFSLHFRGAWGSEGLFSFGDLAFQAKAGLKFLRGQDFVDARRLAVFGFSMGGWTAISLGSLEPGLRGVAAVAPVGGPEMVTSDTRRKIAHLCQPLRVKSADFLHRDFIAAVHRWDPARSAAKLRCPLLLIHGEADEMVALAVSRRIFAAAHEPKKLVKVPGARHDFLDRRDWLARTVVDWLSALLKV